MVSFIVIYHAIRFMGGARDNTAKCCFSLLVGMPIVAVVLFFLIMSQGSGM